MKEFKDFAMKGNVIDMAVGVVIGGAFGKIITSLVNDLIMPLIGALIGNVDFTTLSATLRAPKLDEAGEVVKQAVTLNYGNFIQVTVDFLLVALCIFFVIRLSVMLSTTVVSFVTKRAVPRPLSTSLMVGANHVR